MKNIKFVWVTHYKKESLENVKSVLAKFRPDLIGLELDKTRLSKLIKYKKRHKSGAFEGYSYAKAHNIPIAFMDNSHHENFHKLLDSLGFFSYIRLFVLFSIKNLLRLLIGKRLRKLRVEDDLLVEKYLLKERDKHFVCQIKKISAENKGKRILFIFGRAHKKGILKGVMSTTNSR